MTDRSNFYRQFTEYQKAVEAFDALPKDKPPTRADVENVIVNALALRDQLHFAISDYEELNGEDLQQIYKLDAALFKHVSSAAKKHKLDVGKWRDIFPSRDNLQWWWYLDKRLVRRDGKITPEEPISWMFLLSGVVVAMALGIMLLTTQSLWSNGLELVGNVNLVLQGLAGIGLVTEQGRNLLNQIGESFGKLTPIDDTEKMFLNVPEAKAGRGLFIGSLIFLSIVLITTFLLLPIAAVGLHRLGITALESGNVTGARFYFDLSIRIRPDFGLFPKPDSAASMAQVGVLFWQDGNVPAAIDAFEQALSADSRLVLAQYHLGRIYTGQGEFHRAATMFDRCINLLNDHLASEIRLPVTDDLAKQQLFRCYVARADAYMLSGVTLATLADLRSARELVENNPNLFLSVENKDDPPDHAEPTTEMYVLEWRVNSALYRPNCGENYRTNALEAQRVVRVLGIDPRQSAQRLWLYEVNMPLTCETAN
jgi:tetratricopeptide (TPR) repeat protein